LLGQQYLESFQAKKDSSQQDGDAGSLEVQAPQEDAQDDETAAAKGQRGEPEQQEKRSSSKRKRGGGNKHRRNKRQKKKKKVTPPPSPMENSSENEIDHDDSTKSKVSNYGISPEPNSEKIFDLPLEFPRSTLPEEVKCVTDDGDDQEILPPEKEEEILRFFGKLPEDEDEELSFLRDITNLF